MRHPWSRARRRDKSQAPATPGARWDAMAQAFRQAAQERSGDAQPQGGADVPADSQRTTAAAR